MFKQYFWEKQTLKQLSNKFGLNERTLQKKIHSYTPSFNTKSPRELTAVIDSVYFGKRDKNGFGVIVVFDAKEKEIVAREFIKQEDIVSYLSLRKKLEKKGFVFKAVVVDGKKALFSVFSDIPLQMCIFHQKAIIRRYLTKNPKLEASIELQGIVDLLTTNISEKEFKKLLTKYENKWKDFLNEKTLNPNTNRYFFTHKRLRSALRSLKTNLPFLFTHKKYPDLNMPTTTNDLDGGVFSPLKRLIKVHPGISVGLKKKLIDEFLENFRNKDKKR